MKTYFSAAILVCALWLHSSTSLGQAVPDSSLVAAPRVNHKFAVGIRFSTFSDKENSLSGKYFLTPKSALHLTIGQYAGRPTSLSTTMLYERYRSLFHSTQLRCFYGLGLNVTTAESRRDFRLDDISFHVAGSLGAEYSFKKLPLAFGVDGRQLLLLRQGDYNLSSANIAVSAHYLFK